MRLSKSIPCTVQRMPMLLLLQLLLLMLLLLLLLGLGTAAAAAAQTWGRAPLMAWLGRNSAGLLWW